MKFLRFILAIWLLISHCASSYLYSQYRECGIAESNDSILGIKTYKYPSLLTTAKTMGINAIIWSFDRFIVKEDWAYINGKTIKRNFKKGLIWDSNCYSTNMFSHPFHGSLYYSSARSSGLTWWQSIPFVLGGSFMWEFFMESEYPSTNDLIATTFGGIALGEMSFRATDLLVDNRLRGAGRIGREVAIAVFSPMRGIHRIITGEMWKKSNIKGSLLRSYPYELSISIGPRLLYDNSYGSKCKTGGVFDLEFLYGELSDGNVTEPYEWFNFNIMLNAIESSPLISKWSSRGLLFGKTFEKNENSCLTLGAFQHFMYYDLQPSETHFTLGEASSFGPGLIYQNKYNGGRDTFKGEFYVNAVPLGAVGSDYMVLGDRDYNWGTGYGAKSYLDWKSHSGLSLSVGLEMNHLFSWNGYDKDVDWSKINPNDYNIQGDKSNALSMVSSLDFSYMFNDKWGMSFTYNNYYRYTKYDYFESKAHKFSDFRLSAMFFFSK